jgi:hypothetical protein
MGMLGSLVWNTRRLGPLPPARRRALISQWQAAAQGTGLMIIPMIVFEPREYAEAFATFTGSVPRRYLSMPRR